MLSDLKTKCYEFSIFELWARDGEFDEEAENEIMNLTRAKILDKINNVNMR